MKIQLHVGTKTDLSFYLRHFWPMKSFRQPRLKRKTDCHFKIPAGAIQPTYKSQIYDLKKKIFYLVFDDLLHGVGVGLLSGLIVVIGRLMRPSLVISALKVGMGVLIVVIGL